MGLVMALNCCVDVCCGMRLEVPQLNSCVITGTLPLLSMVHTSGSFANNFLSKSQNFMLICSRKPMYFMDVYDCHSECISHIHSSRWILRLINTLRTGHLNCLNARPWGLNNVIQLLYCVSVKIYDKFANYFCELKFSGNTHQRP